MGEVVTASGSLAGSPANRFQMNAMSAPPMNPTAAQRIGATTAHTMMLSVMAGLPGWACAVLWARNMTDMAGTKITAMIPCRAADTLATRNTLITFNCFIRSPHSLRSEPSPDHLQNEIPAQPENHKLNRGYADALRALLPSSDCDCKEASFS